MHIWVKSQGRPLIPTPIVYDWRAPAGMRGPESAERARAFVAEFAWDADDTASGGHEPWFNITIDA